MAADDDVDAVIEFLRKNGLKEAESALKEDMIEKCDLGSFDFEKFLFPVLPPVKIPATLRRPDIEEVNGAERSGGSASGSSSSPSDDDEFVSLGSSTSDFTNPYGLRSASRGSSDASSDSLSQFDTARDYHDYDMQNDLYWHDEEMKETS
ncbi:hypothetical protein Dsin_000840 [Dipteronia sinensis]|uniref:Uncharacterized protein n=1 Tax=Dipteronia sinensis TaxID=43782 RepID=A0AAE0B473_9ROSI|nr:hypothetical protein Dsin_000840 [Dipteronia sinensis]